MTRREQRLSKGGVYAAPADIESVRADYARTGGLWRSLDLSTVHDKAALLGALARTLEFPQYFGHNWDALADSVEDLSWLQWSHLAVEISHSDALRRAAPGDWDTALDILRHAATYWASRRKSLLVLVLGDSELPVYRR